MKGTDPIRAEIHCNWGSAGRVVDLDAEQPPENQPRRAARGTWAPAQREPGESPTSSTTRALYRCASRAAAAVGGARPWS